MDDADATTDIMAKEIEWLIQAEAKPLAVGVPGECDRCEEHSPRLVGGYCAPCRDVMKRYKGREQYKEQS